MAAAIPPQFLDLLSSKVTFAHLATVMSNGTPQVTPMWFSYDGTHIVMNSAKGRVKDRNMRAKPHVALSILDPDDPYRYIQIMGDITTITEEGGVAHVNALTKKYLGQDNYPYGQPGEVRVIYKISPTRVQTRG